MEKNVIEIPLLDLEKKARDEAYAFIDKYLRPLPKKSDGTFDTESEEFQDNDVDALRHAYASGVFTMEYNAITANILGKLRESFPGNNSPSGNLRIQGDRRNMDLWNNAVGRKYGKTSKTREELFQSLLKALKNGELIITLDDPRKYSANTDPASSKIKDRVIVLKESKTGKNTLFLDTEKLVVFSREDFVAKIKAGEYGAEYEIRIVKGKEIPASKRDGSSNLG